MPTYKPRRGARIIGRIKLAVALIFAAVVLTLGVVMTRIDDRLMPIVTAQTNEMARNIMNLAIDASLAYASAGISTEDFFTITQDSDGMVLSLSVNTMLVNLVCNAMAVNISNILGPPTVSSLSLPIGSLLNIDILSNVGPTLPVSFRYVGGAQVDYETEFRSVGINQVNFQLWVVVESSIRVVNPLEDKDVRMTRKIALVDTVFSGRVPHMYLNIDQ
ncbi:MAG: sporulation protein YunB [Defluviitaleaceae bacterium]|nr:sporulation protein YunB [Defluviitaleaceae bacterium]